MKILSYIDGDTDQTMWDLEDKWFDNRQEVLVRPGGDVFECRFDPEFGAESFVCDPRRSMVLPVYNSICRYSAGDFQTADFLYYLMRTLGIDAVKYDLASVVAFQTILSAEAAKHLALSYLHIARFSSRHPDVVRVINNPFFYADPRAGESRMLEVAEDHGLRFAVDLTKWIPSSSDLAREIALLNHVQEGEASVMAIYQQIYPQVNDVLCGVM